MRFAPAGLRAPVGVLGLERPTGPFDSRGVQIMHQSPQQKSPAVGALIFMVVEEGFEPPTLCL